MSAPRCVKQRGRAGPVDPRAPETAVSSTVRTSDSVYVPAAPKPAVRAARVITFFFGVLQALLILNVSNPSLEPSRGMFALDRVRADQGSVFDLAALVALIGWTLIEALILAALRIFARRPSQI